MKLIKDRLFELLYNKRYFSYKWHLRKAYNIINKEYFNGELKIKIKVYKMLNDLVSFIVNDKDVSSKYCEHISIKVNGREVSLGDYDNELQNLYELECIKKKINRIL